jgi:hypothetical protein
MKSIDVKLPHINKFLQFITHNNVIYIKPNANAFSYIDNNFVWVWNSNSLNFMIDDNTTQYIYNSCIYIYIFVIVSFNTSSNLIFLKKLVIFDTFLLLLDFMNVIFALFHLLFLSTYQCCQLWKPNFNCNFLNLFKIGIFNPSFHICLN